MGCGGSKHEDLKELISKYQEKHPQLEFGPQTREKLQELYNKTENAEELRDLNEDQFCEMMTEFGFPGNKGNFVAIFKSFDANKNGLISLKEFMLIVRIMSEDMPEEKIKWAFKTYDANDDGTIDAHEMKRLVAAVYLSLADYIPSIKEDLKIGSDGLGEEKAEELFKKLDLNADGRVSKEEALKACTSDPELAKFLNLMRVATF